MIEKYCTHGTGWNPGQHAFILDEYLQRENTWQKEINEWLSKETVEAEIKSMVDEMLEMNKDFLPQFK